MEEIREHGYDFAFNTYKETVCEAVHYDAPDEILALIDTLHTRIGDGLAALQSLIASAHEA